MDRLKQLRPCLQAEVDRLARKVAEVVGAAGDRCAAADNFRALTFHHLARIETTAARWLAGSDGKESGPPPVLDPALDIAAEGLADLLSAVGKGERSLILEVFSGLVWQKVEAARDSTPQEGEAAQV
jgi:hypothetical protein